MTTSNTYLDDMVQGYLYAALWSSVNCYNRGATFLEDNYAIDDFAPESVAQARADCEDFVLANWAELDLALSEARYTADSSGIDFWLSRNGHGAGFFDRKIPSAESLQAAAQIYRGIDPVLGDDGLIYFE